MRFICTSLLLFIFIKANAIDIFGKITNVKNTPLSHASILVKGTNIGTTANEKGLYNLHLKAGNYTISCQHVGYKTVEKNIVVTTNDIELHFELEEQEYKLDEVVIQKGEDPAYGIIKNAIKTREEHLYEIKKFETEVYVKGQMQLRNYPKKFLGNEVDFEDGDTSKKKMIFLSESIANYYVDGKNNSKIDVISTRVSGASDGFGLASPQIISFYNNMINVGRGLNPRGFVSPIADNALHYYKYKFKGTFYENGKEISRIQVIPKRKYEPLFNGYINIIENEWRIHSTDLYLLKDQQLQILDTLSIQQMFMPISNQWIIKQQVIHPAGKFFGFDFFGNIVQVYNKFNTNVTFAKDFFDNTVMKFYDSSNKKTKAYWDSIRPIPLLDLEAKDYKKKDSLEQIRKDPKYLDSLDKRNNKITLSKLFILGYNRNNEKNKSHIYLEPLIESVLQYNTVEGLVANIKGGYVKNYSKRKELVIAPNIRYGFSNHHFNASLNTSFNFGKKYFSHAHLNFGTTVYQFDKQNPISAFDNTLASLKWKRNYLKIYEAQFATISFGKELGHGFNFNTEINYENRLPLENTTDYSWKKYDDRFFTPNYPTQITLTNIVEHKALSIGFTIKWKPGTKYIEFPDRKISLGSKYPNFSFSFTQGINNILGSSVDYSKWQFGVNDNLNLKLGGRISYALKAAGFAHNTKSYLPDMNHVLGNQISTASEYLNSFQLMPYYLYSNTAKFYTQAHIEYHLNGLLTNKIPFIKKLNWFLVVGANALYNNDEKQGYYESFISVENILKIFRIDFVKAFQSSKTQNEFGIKFSTAFLNRRK